MFWKKKKTLHPKKSFTPMPGSPFYFDPKTIDPSSSTPLTGDVELDSISVSAFSNGTPVHISESLIYRHSDRTVIRRGSASNGVNTEKVELETIPDSIKTREELIRYTRAHGVMLPH